VTGVQALALVRNHPVELVDVQGLLAVGPILEIELFSLDSEGLTLPQRVGVETERRRERDVRAVLLALPRGWQLREALQVQSQALGRVVEEELAGCPFLNGRNIVYELPEPLQTSHRKKFCWSSNSSWRKNWCSSCSSEREFKFAFGSSPPSGTGSHKEHFCLSKAGMLSLTSCAAGISENSTEEPF